MDISSDLVSILYNLDNNKKVQGGLLPYFIGCNSHSILHSKKSQYFPPPWFISTFRQQNVWSRFIKGLIQVIKMYSLDFHVTEVYNTTRHLQKFMCERFTILSLKGTIIKKLTILCYLHKKDSMYKPICEIEISKMSVNLWIKFDIQISLLELQQIKAFASHLTPNS